MTQFSYNGHALTGTTKHESFYLLAFSFSQPGVKKTWNKKQETRVGFMQVMIFCSRVDDHWPAMPGIEKK